MKTAQRFALVTVAGLPGTFARKTGGNITAEVTKSYDGGSEVPELLTGPPNHENVTVGRDYDPTIDEPMLRQLRPVAGRWITTVVEQPTDTDMVPFGPPITRPGAKLVEIHEPETDAGSATAKRLELVFAIATVR